MEFQFSKLPERPMSHKWPMTSHFSSLKLSTWSCESRQVSVPWSSLQLSVGATWRFIFTISLQNINSAYAFNSMSPVSSIHKAKSFCYEHSAKNYFQALQGHPSPSHDQIPARFTSLLEKFMNCWKYFQLCGKKTAVFYLKLSIARKIK